MDDSGPAVQYSGIEVIVTVMLSIHRVSSSSSHARTNEGRVTDHHGQQGHRTCERDVPHGLDGLYDLSGKGCNWREG